MYLEKIHINQRIKSFLRRYLENRCPQKGQGGYMLLSMLAMMLLLTAAYSSLVFVEKKEYNWNFNYALGQQFATISKAAHTYVQNVAFDPDYVGHSKRAAFLAGATAGNNLITVNDLIDEGFLPANFPANLGASQNKYQDIQITAFADVVGSPNAAPTAYVVMDIDVDTANDRRRTPADIAAFRVGAASKGLARMGIRPPPEVELATPAIPCGVETSRVRWGDNPSDCLSDGDIAAITNGVVTVLDQNDAIAPAWEIVTEITDQQAVFRYPQPNRPDGQTINIDITLDGNNVTDVDYARVTNDMTVAGDMTINLTAANLGSLNVTGDSVLAGNVTTTAVVSGGTPYDGDVATNSATANNGVTVGSAGAPSELAITTGGLNEGVGHDAVLTIDDGVGTGQLDIVTLLQEQDPLAGSGLTLDLQGGNDLIVTGLINHFGGGSFNVDGNGVNPGNFQAPSSDIDMVGNDMTLTGAGLTAAANQIVINNPLNINSSVTFGSLTIDPANNITITEDLDIAIDCFGPACPDAITDPPADPF